MTPAQEYALDVLKQWPLNEIDLLIKGIRKSTMRTLEVRGMVKYYPYSRPAPTWKITAKGRS